MLSRAITLFVAVLMTPLLSVGQEALLEDAKFFETNIRPLLAERCFACHSERSVKSGLRLDSAETMRKGGKRGPSVIPHKPEESLFIKAISYEDPDLRMPPNKKLPDEQIQLLTDWIKRGAIWPQIEADENKKDDSPDFTEEEQNFWAFQPIQDPAVPDVDDQGWSANPIDHFIYRKLAQAGLTPAGEAEREVLIRRVYYDLTGLPPSHEEVDTFVNDESPDAYEKLVDNLLASPRYGEKWARYWLDVVRYAESDGYKADHYRPNAWRYRDYVINAFNSDKPYNRFVMEQLAGDEIAPDSLEATVATSFLRLGIYEYNQRDARTQWTVILNDLTDVTGDAFLGMSVSCARCHNHKFDPILQKDYYRIQAFFTPITHRNDVPLATSDEWVKHQQQLAQWRNEAAPILEQIEAIEKPRYDKGADDIRDTFPEDVKAVYQKDLSERSPLDHQIMMLVERQAIEKGDEAVANIKGNEKEKLDDLYNQLKKFDDLKPKALPTVMTVSDVGPYSPSTAIPDTKQKVEPGVLSILNAEPATIDRVPTAPNSTGRRTALARWITDPKNPLTNRVIVNRVWQYHFGKGLVATPSEFGKLGEKPSHPELLDWLTSRFIENGTHFKYLHKLIVMSSTYRQTSRRSMPDIAKVSDPQNRLLWKMNIRRKTSEEIRDSMLVVSGGMDYKQFGESVDWKSSRRTIYTKVYRNQMDPLLEVFDSPDGISSVAERNATTTPLQSLLMINGKWVLNRSQQLARQISKSGADDLDSIVRTAYQYALGRSPYPREQAEAAEFLRQHIQVIKSRSNQDAEGMLLALQTFLDSEMDSDVRIQVVQYLEKQTRELKNSKDIKTVALAGGEGGPHPARNKENLSSVETGNLSGTTDDYQQAAVVDFCQILLNSSEFLYIE